MSRSYSIGLFHPKFECTRLHAGAFALRVGQPHHDVVIQRLVENPIAAGGQQLGQPQLVEQGAVYIMHASDDARRFSQLFQIHRQRLAVASPTALDDLGGDLLGWEELRLRLGFQLGFDVVAEVFEPDQLVVPGDAAEAALDGIYVVRRLCTGRTAGCGRLGALVQEPESRRARLPLHVDSVELNRKVSPVYHDTETRVCAHVFLCLLAYHVEWYM